MKIIWSDQKYPRIVQFMFEKIQLLLLFIIQSKQDCSFNLHLLEKVNTMESG